MSDEAGGAPAAPAAAEPAAPPERGQHDPIAPGEAASRGKPVVGLGAHPKPQPRPPSAPVTSAPKEPTEKKPEPTKAKEKPDGEKDAKPSDRGVDGGGKSEGEKKAPAPEPRKAPKEDLAAAAEKNGESAVDSEEKSADEGEDPVFEFLEDEEDPESKQQVALSDLKEAWRYTRDAREQVRTARLYADDAKQIIRNLAGAPTEENKEGTLQATAEELLRIFTAKFGGDERKALGHFYELSEMMLLEKLKYAKMTPEQRAMWEQAQRGTRAERELESYRHRERLEKQQTLEAEHARETIANLKEALQTAGLPETKFHMVKVEETLRALKREGYDVTYPQVARMVKRELEKWNAEKLQAASLDEILRLRPDLEEAITKRAIEKVRRPRPSPAKTAHEAEREERAPGKRRAPGLLG